MPFWLLPLLVAGAVAALASSSKGGGASAAKAPKTKLPTPPAFGRGGAVAVTVGPVVAGAVATPGVVLDVVLTKAQLAAQATALARLKAATTKNDAWASGQTFEVAVMNAGLTYQTGKSRGGAPLPLPGEPMVDYDNRVLPGDWSPGTGTFGWAEALATEIGGATFDVLTPVLQTASMVIDPTGDVAKGIGQVNDKVQAGLSADRAAT